MTTARMPKIFVLNRQRQIAVDCGPLEEFARQALPLCAVENGSGLADLDEITVVLVSDRKISQLHGRFMQIDGPTDVITFQHGEIFISVETARRQMNSYGTSLDHELRLYLVHGLLHLQGFDDAQPAGRRQMSALQNRILNALSA